MKRKQKLKAFQLETGNSDCLSLLDRWTTKEKGRRNVRPFLPTNAQTILVLRKTKRHWS